MRLYDVCDSFNLKIQKQPVQVTCWFIKQLGWFLPWKKGLKYEECIINIDELHIWIIVFLKVLTKCLELFVFVFQMPLCCIASQWVLNIYQSVVCVRSSNKQTILKVKLINLVRWTTCNLPYRYTGNLSYKHTGNSPDGQHFIMIFYLIS